MLNVKRPDLQTILDLLPALQRPTISSLSDEEWVGQHDHRGADGSRPHPEAEGGARRGIVEYPLNKIVL